MIKQANYIRFLRKYTSTVEKVIVTILIFMMSLILISATLELVYTLFMDFYTRESLLISLDVVMDTFGGFLLILIGIELLETIKVYLNQNIVHVEVVVLVAIIALARKIVILKVEELSLEITAGIGFLVLALGIVYYLIKKTGIMILTLNENCEDDIPEQKNNNLLKH
ncbi:MAG: phosphate-starvation-inducible PsiE family protein [Paludibacteraceae bacterium]|nr:phosphate-starvation-inducible PsiE family protein [Paludibacteraceae bacterium]